MNGEAAEQLHPVIEVVVDSRDVDVGAVVHGKVGAESAGVDAVAEGGIAEVVGVRITSVDVAEQRTIQRQIGGRIDRLHLGCIERSDASGLGILAAGCAANGTIIYVGQQTVA